MRIVAFEVHRQSFLRRGDASTAPFPGCRWNAAERRWEWEAGLLATLADLAAAEGCPVLLVPSAEGSEDLPVLEIRDEHEGEG